MSKTISLVVIFLTILSLPWLTFMLWETLPYEVRLNYRTVKNIFNVSFGLLIGVLFVKQNIKLKTLPILLILLVTSNVIWSIQRFESNKQTLIHNRIDPHNQPDCEKESNYEHIWDYMANGCHYSTQDFISTRLDEVLVLTISILLSRILLISLLSIKSNKKDQSLLDQ